MLPALVIFGLLLAAIPASALGQQPRYNNNRFDTESASQSLIQGNPINICEYCQCEKTTIVCDFQKTKKPLSSIWNSAIAVPPNYTAIQVILTRDTKLELHDGFFQVKNRVNRVIIIGGGQVEITPFAFRNNQGGYPDIQILNVSNVFLKEHSFSGREFKLTVEECDTLVLFPEAFSNVNASCNFVRINHLEINKKAFSTNSTVNLYIEEAQMREIQSFEVVMNKINITKSTIGTILTKAFDVTNINELSFENCRIRKIETNALTNRLFSNHVSITDCHIDAIDKEAISGSGITELTLKNNTIETIESEALKVHSTLVFIQDNTVMHSGNDWLMVTDGQQIVVENNHFKDSGQVSLGHSKNPLNCSFANNRLDSAKSIILNITNCVVRYITTARSCNCNSSDVATSFDHDFSSEIYCTLDARDQSCFNASSVNSRRYSNEACGTMLPNRTMRCTDGSVRIHRKGYGFITKEENAQINRGMPISHIVGIVFGVLTVLLVPICIAYCCLRKLCNRKGCERTDKAKYCFKSQSELSELKSGVANLPDNSSLRKKCERLMANNGKQTIAECSKHITKLISQTNDIPHDINLCLERHLKNHNLNNTLSSHIEAYGGGGGVGGVLGGDDVMTAIGNNSSQPAPSAPILQNELLGDNPIYEELQETQGPQQPLLYGIYSEPLESGSVAPVYSEPFNAADANDMPPPYQAEYATPMRHHHHQVPQSSTLSIQQQQQQQIPSSHTFNNTINHNNNINNNNNARYATPVWRSAASATPTATATTTMPFMASPPITHAQRHVRDLRQDLEAKPQFHPNQLTSIRNQRQLHLTQVGPTATTSTTPTPVTATIRHPQQLQLQRNPRQQLSNSSSRNSFECLDGAASLAAMEHMDMRGAAGGCDTGSDHSGGSDETVKIDDVIQYADA